MSRVPLELPPGLHRLSTSAATGRNWFDMSLVRWNGRELQPIGGWIQLPSIQLDGPTRAITSWRDNAALRWVAAASLAQVMVYNGQGYDISPPDFQAGAPGDLQDGYGIGDFGVGNYGTPRIADPTFEPRGAPGDTVTFDNWGENLIVCGSADGRILWWIPDVEVTTKLVPIPPAEPTPEESAGIVHVVPTQCRLAFITDERFVVALGADGDPRRVSWSDQERPGAWTPDIANQCGSLQLKSTGMALAARRVPQGHLIWCDDDVHLMTFVGPPYAYGIVRVGTGSSAISPQAMVATASRTVWMGQECFWIYEGVPYPLKCDIQDEVFSNINRNTQGRIVGYHNGIFPEIWWHYPDATSLDPNRYVAWNYQYGLWLGGLLPRTGATEPGAFGVPLCGDVDGFLYAHESGWLANGVDRGASVFAETGDLVLGEADRGTVVRAFYPDFTNHEQVQLRVFGQWEPEDEMEDFGIFPYERTDGVIDALFEARAIRLRFEGVTQPDVVHVKPWRLGLVRLDVVPGSPR